MWETSTVMVGAPAHSATRSFSDASVDPGAQFDVTIEAANYGSFGQVVETLPVGFGYVTGSVTPSDVGVEVAGQEVRFSLFVGHESFTYSVTASDVENDYTFSGVVKDEDLEEATVGGESDVVVGAGAPVYSATRSFSDSRVDPGAQLDVTIEAAGYGSFGQVVETLPAGFSYVTGSITPSEIGVEVAGQEVRFSLFGETSFTYTVTAPSVEDDHTFSGVVMNEDRQSLPVGGVSSITVGVAPS